MCLSPLSATAPAVVLLGGHVVLGLASQSVWLQFVPPSQNAISNTALSLSLSLSLLIYIYMVHSFSLSLPLPHTHALCVARSLVGFFSRGPLVSVEFCTSQYVNRTGLTPPLFSGSPQIKPKPPSPGSVWDFSHTLPVRLSTHIYAPS